MRIRRLIGAAAAALAMTVVGSGVTASATEFLNPIIGYQACLDRHDLVEFFRNNSPADKYCFGPSYPDTIYPTSNIPLNHITWIHTGNYWMWMAFDDGADGISKSNWYAPFTDTGCTNCNVTQVYVPW